MNRAGGHSRVLSMAVAAAFGVCSALAVAAASPAGAVMIDEQTRTVTASRLSMTFGAVGPDVVKEVKWTNSVGVQGANLAADSGEATCATKQLGEPANFWGESYGTEEGSQPRLVYGGSSGSWTAPAANPNQVQTATEYSSSCLGPGVPVNTTYTYYDEAPFANEIMVQRTWHFDLVMNPQIGKSTALRAYVPQLPLAQYGQVLLPSGGTLMDFNANQCTTAACLQALSAGWFAIDDETPGDADAGSGVIVLRDASDTPGAQLAIQALETPGPAHSEPIANESSIALPVQSGSLTSALSETEYLCFYDEASWSQARRRALELPAGCGPVPVPAQEGGSSGGSPSGGAGAGSGGAGGGGTGGGGAPGPPRPLPAPVLAHSFNVAPSGGLVRVELPGTHTFVALAGAQQLPFGAIIDATQGTVTVTTAVPGGGTQTGQFFDGEFLLRQGRGGEVVAVLAGGNFSVCPTARERAHRARAGAARATGSHAVRKLWANAHGKFSTQGNYAAGAVQGTEWLTEDRCDGTLIRVTRDRVAVTNLLTHRHLSVRAGHSYFAKAP